MLFNFYNPLIKNIFHESTEVGLAIGSPVLFLYCIDICFLKILENIPFSYNFIPNICHTKTALMISNWLKLEKKNTKIILILSNLILNFVWCASVI